MRKVIIAILSLIAIATIVLPEGEYGQVTITSYAAEGQFNSNGLQANNLGIPIDEFVDAPATAPVPFGELVDAPMTAPPAETTMITKETTTTTTKVATSIVELAPAPETEPEVLDTAPATAPTTSTSTSTTTVTTTTTTATTSTSASASTVLADMKCADGAELRVSEDSNGKVEIEASGEKDLLKEIFGFIKDLFS